MYMQRNIRRNQILTESTKIVTRKGWASLTVANVAVACSVSERTIHRFFTGRIELAQGVIAFAEINGDKETARKGKELGF
jgi:AcrR family transcriptional regulator